MMFGRCGRLVRVRGYEEIMEMVFSSHELPVGERRDRSVLVNREIAGLGC